MTPADAPRLEQIVRSAAPGTTIILADGSYPVRSSLPMRTPGVTLRGASNDASKVIIDGGYAVGEIVAITAANVTLAHLTLSRALHHPVHIYPPGPGANADDIKLYGLHLVDGGQQFVKANPIAGQIGWTDRGLVACSRFVLTPAGRARVEAAGGGCYTGGVDVHAAAGWLVRHNRFEGIYCENGELAEHAVHFWRGSRDTVVENNLIVNCARGIGFGLGGGRGHRRYADRPHGGADLAHYDGVIRNNVVYATIPYYDTGVELQDTRRPVVVHNTIVSTPSAAGFFSSIDYRFAQTDVVIQNNLTRRISARDGARGLVSHNAQAVPFAWFRQPAALDFHLLPLAGPAIDRGVPHASAGLDLDGQAHAIGPPDLGADEVVP